MPLTLPPSGKPVALDPRLKVAIAHDYMTQRGGAERVVLSIAKAFPHAPIFTSLYEPEQTFPEFRNHDLSTSQINRFRSLRKNHRRALPVLPLVFGRTTLTADVVICSSSGWSHGINTTGRKLVYCHNPARWLYQTDDYLGGHDITPKRVVLTALKRPLIRWDRRQALSAHRYIANSNTVRARIDDAYGIRADIVHPPVTIDAGAPREPVPNISPGFALCVSRLLPYKHVAEVVEAFRSLDLRLVVVGEGPEEQRIRQNAPDNVYLAGSVTDAQLRWLYAKASVLVAASHEDFGLTPLEAGVFGTPTAALGRGGFLETVEAGVTGIFFDEPTPEAIRNGVRWTLTKAWDSDVIRSHSNRFSEASFVNRLREIVSDLVR